MQIWRIENKTNGRGPYPTANGVGQFYDMDRHPDPELEGWRDIEFGGPWYFGFKSYRQMRQWFHVRLNEWFWKQFGPEGKWRLTVWDCPDEYTRTGMAQVVFQRDAAPATKLKSYHLQKREGGALRWTQD